MFININVGGQEFKIMLSTLAKYPESLLYKEACKLKNTNTLYIDRDPKLFPIILNFIRDFRSTLPKLATSDWKSLLLELDYYNITAQIDVLVEKLVYANEQSSICETILYDTEAQVNHVKCNKYAFIHDNPYNRHIYKIVIESIERLVFERYKKMVEQCPLIKRKAMHMNI